MKKLISKKIISSVIILVVFSLIVSPLQSKAAINLNWDNPNQGGDRQFKFTSSNVSSQALFMSVVGCTGAANRVAGAVTGFLSSTSNKSFSSWLDKTTAKENLDQAVNTANTNLETEAQRANTLEECLNGIAFSLAKNQLTKMTRDAVNWVNSGFSGDPLYVRSITSFTNTIERDLIEKNIYTFSDPSMAFPYGMDFAQSTINSYRATGGIYSGLERSFSSFVSDLGSFLSDPDTYYDTTANQKDIIKDGSYSSVRSAELTTTKRTIQDVINLFVVQTPESVKYIYNADDFNNVLSSLKNKKLIDYTTVVVVTQILNSLKTEIETGNITALEITTNDISTTINTLNRIIKAPAGNNTYSSVYPYYSSIGTYGTETTKTALERAREANERFANDFAVGGWDAWDALTQRDQNNPLGFTLEVSQRLLENTLNETENAKQEVYQNNGFLNQKKCVLWHEYTEDGRPKYEESVKSTSGLMSSTNVPVTQKSKPEYGKCIEWETVTPGSIVKENLSNYINSPQTQLELADSINEGLNALFGLLVQKFQGQGLASLSSWTSDITDWSTSSGGVGSNKIFDAFGNDLGSAYDKTSKDYSRGFDITKDLGNTYARGVLAGTWDAKTNTPELAPGIGVKNHYYVVSVGGKDFGLVALEGGQPHIWKPSERIFFNGKSWEIKEPSELLKILQKRGIIQIQKDYIVQAQDLLKKLNDKNDGVMVSLGELDYCIPGPNPNWFNNSSDIRDAYLDYISGMRAETTDNESGFMQIYKIINVPHLLGLWDSGATKSVLFVPDWSMYQSFFNGTNLWDKIFDQMPQQPFFTLFKLSSGKISTPGVQPSIQISSGFSFQILDLQFGADSGSVKEKADYMVERQVQFWEEYVSRVGQEYRDKIKLKYGNALGGMLSPYKKNGEKDNPNYLDMAQAGLNLTKNIVAYDENVDQTTRELEANIDNAKANIYKLEKIKEEVDKIVKEAQKRRAEERKKAGLPAIPQECLDEELVNYFDE